MQINTEEMRNRPLYNAYYLGILTLIYIFNIADRYVISTLIEPIKSDLGLSDTAIGFLTGTALAIFYTGMGIPLGMIADRVNRRNLVALSIAIWSLMTAACGGATSFAQLLLARIGVGVGEAGGTPASQSLISDLYPPENRSVVMSIFSLGAAAGSMIGSVGGGKIGGEYGWRTAFLVLAVPGVVLALVLRLTVGEPRRGVLDGKVNTAATPTLKQALSFIRRQPALFHVLTGSAVVTFWGWGLLWWTPAFLSRSFGMSTQAAGSLIGTISGLAGAVGIVIGAILTYKLSRNDARWQPWIVAMATVVGTVLSTTAYISSSQTTTTICLWLFVPTAYLNIGPMLAMTQSLSPPSMRGLTCAILLFGANIANLALAPQLIGIASDILQSRYSLGQDSLRYALVGMTFSGFWAAYHFWAAGKAMERVADSMERSI